MLSVLLPCQEIRERREAFWSLRTVPGFVNMVDLACVVFLVCRPPCWFTPLRLEWLVGQENWEGHFAYLLKLWCFFEFLNERCFLQKLLPITPPQPGLDATRYPTVCVSAIAHQGLPWLCSGCGAKAKVLI